jgi:hypothetical protein
MHDHQSLALENAIERHKGEAEEVTERFFDLTAAQAGQRRTPARGQGARGPSPAATWRTRSELVTRFSIRDRGAPDVDLGYQGSPARDKLIGMTAARRR